MPASLRVNPCLEPTPRFGDDVNLIPASLSSKRKCGSKEGLEASSTTRRLLRNEQGRRVSQGAMDLAIQRASEQASERLRLLNLNGVS